MAHESDFHACQPGGYCLDCAARDRAEATDDLCGQAALLMADELKKYGIDYYDQTTATCERDHRQDELEEWMRIQRTTEMVPNDIQGYLIRVRDTARHLIDASYDVERKLKAKPSAVAVRTAE